MLGGQLSTAGKTNAAWSPADPDNDSKGKAVATTGAQPFSPVGLKVLVVDDNRVCLAVLEKMLRQCNYSVTACSSAAAALSLVQGKVIRFDLVLCDVHMPGMDGFKLLEAISLERDLPVIMMSSDDETDVVMKGITRGACDYFLKPVCLQRLQTIWQHVFRRRELGEGISGREGDYTDGDPARARFRNDSRKRKGKEEALDDPADLVNISKKKTRLVWTTALHKQFVDAVKNLGTANAVPKQILEKMNVKGISRENVASHLQKYRKYLTDQEAASSEEKDVVMNGLMNRQAFPIAIEPYQMVGNFGGSIDEIQSSAMNAPSPYALSLQPSSQTFPIPQSFVTPQNFGASQTIPPPQNIAAPQTIPGPQNIVAPSSLTGSQNIASPQNFASSQNFVSPQSIAAPPNLGAPQSFAPHHDFRHGFTSAQGFSPPRNFTTTPGYGASTDLYQIPSQSFQAVEDSGLRFDGAEAMEMPSAMGAASSSNLMHRLRQFPGLVDVVRPSLVSPAFYNNNLDYHS